VAPIEMSVDRVTDLTELTVTGEVTAQDLLDVIAAIYAGGRTTCVLWDFSKAELERVKASDVRPLVEAAQQYSAASASGRTAMVFSSAAAYGLGRIFDQLRQVWDSPVKTMSFRDRGAALAWLKGE
jgi:hypothetical protein